MSEREQAPTGLVGHVHSLHRYPVKSLLGESVGSLVLDRRGVVGDRRWAVLDADGKLGSGKSSRRFRRMDGLLRCSSRYVGDRALVRLPDGRELPALDARCADALGQLVGRPVTVGAENAVSHLDTGPVHLLTTAALRWAASLAPGSAIDHRRFRPNVVVEAEGTAVVEEEWVGRTVTLGGVALRVTARMDRCVMVTLPQRELPHDPRVLSALSGDGLAHLGVVADVARPGRIRVGDPLRLL